MTEVAWPSEMQEARLNWPGSSVRSGIGNLWFLSPENGERCAVPVSKANHEAASTKAGTNVWQIVDNGDGTVTVHPSIHFIGHFHSPNPVTFNLVTDLPRKLHV
jgi:hypothetical protein